MATKENEKSGTSQPDSSVPANPMPRFRSSDLFDGGRRLVIQHGNEEYCLQLTRNERLILTKY